MFKLLSLFLFIVLSLTHSYAQIPIPYLYYDFEDAAGTISVIDSSGNEREGTVNGAVDFGSEGAPQGSTPGAGAQFSSGYINVESSDAPTDFGNRDQGIAASYTMACWVKPDQAAFSGDAFIFGQGNQGIHHGFRGGNTYHAHWGSDFSGTLPLNPDEWAHLTFTYDSDLGRGAIYVNGEFDSEKTDQTGPNGGGSIIIGGRNGGVQNFQGIIDDLAIWQVALDEDQIKAIAEGLSPSGRDNEDDDEDGLPDYYEENLVDNLEDLNGNAAGPGPGSGTGDFDGDGLTDLDEYEETQTNPTLTDTDEDGLSDGVETNTGTFVSATNTGTNPKKADTDKDGLIDSVETNTGVLVDEENTGTNPHNIDSDGDGYSDGGEIAGGTDPNDENSKGAIPQPLLYLDFEEEAVDLSGNAHDGEVDGDVTFDVEGAESGPTPITGASFNGGHLDFPGIDMNSMISNFETGSYTFSCWLKPIGSAGGQGFIWGQTQQGIHNGIRNGGFLHSAHWGADWNASTVLEAEQWAHAAWVYDGENDTATIYLNGQVDGGPQAQRAPNGGGTFILGGRNNGEISFNGYLDDVTIWTEALPEGTIQALADGASPIGATQEDEDGDGLPDSWEEKYGVDDPEGDDDGDGLSNADEFDSRTKPNKADSDEDGLNDKEEIEVTKTNPLNADSDKDGLLDGVETNTGQFVSASNTGTDPNKQDTDEDGFSDDTEISQGTDPTDANDIPQLGLSILFIGGQAEATQGADAAVMSFLEERYGPQNITYKQANQTDAGEESEYAILVISSTPGSGDMRNKFQDSTTPVVNWEEAIADNGSGEFQVTSGRPKDNAAEDHVITILEDHPVTAGFNVGDDVTISTGQTEIWWSTDQQAPGSISLASEQDDPSRLFLTLVDEGEELNDGSLAPGKRVMLGMTDSTFNNFTEDGKTLIGQSIDWALGVAGGITPLNFTEIIYDSEKDTFRLKWNSRGGKTYSLFYSEDLSQFDADLDDSIESGGDFTFYPAEDQPGLENPLSGSKKIFFQVMENEE